MPDLFVVTLNGSPAGVFTTRQKALAFVALLRTQFGDNSRVGLQEFRADELDTVVANDEKVFTVTFPNVQSVQDAMVTEGSPVRGSLEENTFSYNAVTKEFRVIVWAADQSAAGVAGNQRRVAFINLIGAENL